MAGRNQRVGKRRQLVLGDVGGQHARPLGGKGPLRGRSLAPPRSSGRVTWEPSRHRAKLPRAAPHCKLTKLAVRESGPGSGVNCGEPHPPIPRNYRKETIHDDGNRAPDDEEGLSAVIAVLFHPLFHLLSRPREYRVRRADDEQGPWLELLYLGSAPGRSSGATLSWRFRAT
jgi:hypothetical protein